MKTIFTPFAFLFAFALITFSCTKEERNEKRQQVEAPQTLNAVVSAGQAYSLPAITGSTLSITKQASHFQISEVAAATGGGYNYTAAKGYAGADEVTLLQTTTSTKPGGGCHNGQTTTSLKTILIKFNVNN